MIPDAAERPEVVRIARAVVLVATLWFALATSWGLFGRVAGGHDAVVAARGIIAENMLTWHIAGPVRQYTVQRPEPSLYYAHHPWGTFWIITAFVAALGRHAYVPRLVSVLMSTATPPLLYGIGRGLWGPVPGALSALAYTTLPITLAFGNFPGFEVPLVFSCLLTTWGYVHLARHCPRARGAAPWITVSLAGVLMSVNVDWEANAFLAVVLVALAAGMFFGPRRWFDETERRRFAQWASIAVLIAVATAGAYLAGFQQMHLLDGLIGGGLGRTRGIETPLSAVLEERRYWIDLMFTPPAVLIGKLAVPVFLVRVFFLRRALEVFPLAMLVMALVQYVVFKNGADVHIYWPLPFAPYYALSVGVLAATGMAFARHASGGRGEEDARIPLRALVWVGLIPVAILPDAVEALHYGRGTGGRFNERGARIFREDDKSQALEWMAQQAAPPPSSPSPFAIHEAVRPTWAQEWALHSPVTTTSTLPLGPARAGEERFFVSDLAFLEPDDQRRLFNTFAVIAVGPYALVDRALPAQPAQGYAFDEREPTPWEWYFQSGVDPIRTIAVDPWYTWELRDQFGQSPNPVPSGTPTTLERLRIAHNAAFAAGDQALAALYEAELVRQLDARTATRFSDGISLLGTRYTPGVAPTLAVYFAAEGPANADYAFTIASSVEARRMFSLVPPDDRIRQLGRPFLCPPRLWKRGFLYSERSEIRHRPGVERFVGCFGGPPSSSPPHPLGGPSEIPLLTLR